MYNLLEIPFNKKDYINFIIESVVDQLKHINEEEDNSIIAKKEKESNNFISLTEIIDEVIEEITNENEEEIKEISTAGAGGIQGYSQKKDI